MEPIQSSATVMTTRAGRYAKQLVSHISRKVPGDWDDEAGTGHLEFGESRVELAARPDHLFMSLSTSAEDIGRLEDVVGIHLARFGAKDNLVVAWARSDGTRGTTQRLPAQDQPPG